MSEDMGALVRKLNLSDIFLVHSPSLCIDLKGYLHNLLTHDGHKFGKRAKKCSQAKLTKVAQVCWRVVSPFPIKNACIDWIYSLSLQYSLHRTIPCFIVNPKPHEVWPQARLIIMAPLCQLINSTKKH